MRYINITFHMCMLLILPTLCSAQLFQDPFWTYELSNGQDFQLLSALLDNDTYPDLVLGSGAGYCMVFIGTGDGSFSSWDSVTVPYPVEQLVAGDFNNDTRTDVLVRTESLSSVYSLLNLGDGSLSDPIASDAYCRHLTACHFNEDSNLDAVATGGYTVHFLEGAGDGTFIDSIISPPIDWFYRVDHADCNDDGNQDIVLMTLDYVKVYIGDGSGGILGGGSYGYYPGPSPPATSITTGFLDSDSFIDVVLTTATYSGETVFSLTGNGDGSFNTVGSGWLDNLWFNQTVLSDIDLDLKNDAFLAASTDGHLVILRGDGAGGLLEPCLYADSGFIGTEQAAVADFDLDGDIDFAVIGLTPLDAPEIRVYLNQAVELGLNMQSSLIMEWGMQVVPNPFSSSLSISYSLPETAQTTLSIYDLSGRMVEDLVSSSMAGGAHTVAWNPAPEIPDGCYLIVLDAGGERAVRRCMKLD